MNLEREGSVDVAAIYGAACLRASVLEPPGEGRCADLQAGDAATLDGRLLYVRRACPIMATL